MKTKLQAARLERGWTQADLMDAMYEAADRLGIQLPERSSLKTQVSMFENGRRDPGIDYRSVFCEVYQVPRGDLGFARETALPQMSGLPTLPSPQGLPTAVNPETLAYLRAVFAQHTRAEPLVGPRFLVPAVQAQMPLIEQLCKEATGPLREDVLWIGARYCEFLGWLHQDTGDSRTSMLWTNQALDYAEELGDPIQSSYVFQRRSNIATEAGQPGYGLGLANAALRDLGKLPPRVRAVALRTLANSQAMLGEADACAQSLEEAREAAQRGADENDIYAPYCTVSYIDMEAANCDIRLGQPEEAVHTLEASLTHWPSQQQRDRGLCLSRLSTAHALMGDVEGAYQTAHQAVGIAQTTGSARILAELGNLQSHLTPWRKLVEIAELNKTLDSMRGPEPTRGDS